MTAHGILGGVSVTLQLAASSQDSFQGLALQLFSHESLGLHEFCCVLVQCWDLVNSFHVDSWQGPGHAVRCQVLGLA